MDLINEDPQETYSHFPRSKLANITHCMLKQGEVIFVPGGSPHQVENDVDTISISANYVDGAI